MVKWCRVTAASAEYLVVPRDSDDGEYFYMFDGETPEGFREQGSYGCLKSLKVLEFQLCDFKVWKVLGF